MRFLHVTEQQGRYAASLRETPAPVPGKGEMLIRVAASGVNRADLSQIAGRYPPPPGESDILGLEVSGTDADTGQRVCALLAGGGHAEYVAALAGQVFPAPGTLDLGAAAGLPSGATVLVHAGASGVGLAAIQVAKLWGARVAATTRTAGKVRALESAGADLAIDTGRVEFASAIEARWGRDAVDVVLDPIGAASFAGDLRVLATGGRIVFIATMSGATVEADLAVLMKKRARLAGSMLRSRSRAEKATIVARFREELLPAFGSGALQVPVDSRFPPERAAEAFQRMRENRNAGKIV